MADNNMAKGMGALVIFLGLIFVKTSKSFLLESCEATRGSAEVLTPSKPDTFSNSHPQPDEISINGPRLRDVVIEDTTSLKKNGEGSFTFPGGTSTILKSLEDIDPGNSKVLIGEDSLGDEEVNKQ